MWLQAVCQLAVHLRHVLFGHGRFCFVAARTVLCRSVQNGMACCLQRPLVATSPCAHFVVPTVHAWRAPGLQHTHKTYKGKHMAAMVFVSADTLAAVQFRTRQHCALQVHIPFARRWQAPGNSYSTGVSTLLARSYCTLRSCLQVTHDTHVIKIQAHCVSSAMRRIYMIQLALQLMGWSDCLRPKAEIEVQCVQQIQHVPS
jgi:hypothetical protein